MFGVEVKTKSNQQFNSDDDLPLNKPLKLHLVSIIIWSAFEEGGKLYPQVFLDETLHELSVWMLTANNV